MKAYKRIICIAAAVMVSVYAFSSCTVPEAKHIPINEDKNISISWWGSEMRSDYMISGTEEYEKRYSDIEILPYPDDFTGYKQNLDALISCEKEPDIMMINSAWLEGYSPDGEGFLDLLEYQNYFSLENYSESQLDYGMRNGKLNAIPLALNAITFYYNEPMLAEYGLKPLSDWEDLFEFASVLSPDGIHTLSISHKHTWILLIAREEQLSGKEAFGENCFTQENVVSMMEFYARMLDAGVCGPDDYDQNEFLDSKCICSVLWVSNAAHYVEPIEDNGLSVLVGDYIRSPDAKRNGWYVKPTSLYAVSKHSKHPQEAVKYLDYLMNDSYMCGLQGLENGVPLSRAALETLDVKGMLNGVAYEAAQKINQNFMMPLMPAQLEDDERIEDFFEIFDKYYYGQISVDVAAEEFVAMHPYGTQ